MTSDPKAPDPKAPDPEAPDPKLISQAAELIAAAQNGVAFTGAGISAESGIPTYRGHGGVWTKYDPARYANIQSFYSEPEYYWSFFRDVRSKVLTESKPNPAHEALAELERMGRIHTVITQNIDGLHAMAGSGRVLELHGNTRIFDCLSCGRTEPFESVLDLQKKSLIPECPDCSGRLKPRVVFFGESLNPQVLKDAVETTEGCDLMLVVGSTLQVYPAAHLPIMVHQNRKPVIILNLGPTELDHIADCRIEGKAAEALPAVVSEIGSAPSR